MTTSDPLAGGNAYVFLQDDETFTALGGGASEDETTPTFGYENPSVCHLVIERQVAGNDILLETYDLDVLLKAVPAEAWATARTAAPSRITDTLEEFVLEALNSET